MEKFIQLKEGEEYPVPKGWRIASWTWTGEKYLFKFEKEPNRMIPVVLNIVSFVLITTALIIHLVG